MKTAIEIDDELLRRTEVAQVDAALEDSYRRGAAESESLNGAWQPADAEVEE